MTLMRDRYRPTAKALHMRALHLLADTNSVWTVADVAGALGCTRDAAGDALRFLYRRGQATRLREQGADNRWRIVGYRYVTKAEP